MRHHMCSGDWRLRLHKARANRGGGGMNGSDCGSGSGPFFIFDTFDILRGPG